jgi:hypothetical protein
MDIKRKTYDIRTCKKHLFLDISSTNIDTLVPSLYQCVETRDVMAEVKYLYSCKGFEVLIAVIMNIYLVGYNAV